MGSKKTKHSINLDIDNSTDYHKSNEESESSLSEDEFEKGFDVKTDWYVPKSDMKKTVVLKVLYIIKDLFIGNYLKEPTKTEIYSKLRYCEDRNTEFTTEVKEMSWNKLRGITKGMWRKHKKDRENKDLDKYKDFVKLAEKFWELKLTEYLNF